MSEELKIPTFQSEAEDAQWWFDHKDETAKWMIDAISAGRTTHLAAILGKRREPGSSRFEVPNVSQNGAT